MAVSGGVDFDRFKPGPVEASKQEEGKRIRAELSLESLEKHRTGELRCRISRGPVAESFWGVSSLCVLADRRSVFAPKY